MMTAGALASHEDAVAGIFVADMEAELVGVEAAHGGKVIRE